jgi:hypothetical protein
VREALEQRDLQLLCDPQGSLDAGHGAHLCDQLGSARVTAGVRKNDQPQAKARGEPKHEDNQKQTLPGCDRFQQLGHQASRQARPVNRASRRASWSRPPSVSRPLSVSS